MLFLLLSIKREHDVSAVKQCFPKCSDTMEMQQVPLYPTAVVVSGVMASGWRYREPCCPVGVHFLPHETDKSASPSLRWWWWCPGDSLQTGPRQEQIEQSQETFFSLFLPSKPALRRLAEATRFLVLTSELAIPGKRKKEKKKIKVFSTWGFLNCALTISQYGTGNTSAEVHMSSPLALGLMGNVILEIMAYNGGEIETVQWTDRPDNEDLVCLSPKKNILKKTTKQIISDTGEKKYILY